MAFTVILNCLKLAQYIFRHIKTFIKKLSHSEEPEADTIPNKDVMNAPQKSAFSDRRLEQSHQKYVDFHQNQANHNRDLVNLYRQKALSDLQGDVNRSASHENDDEYERLQAKQRSHKKRGRKLQEKKDDFHE